MPRNGYAMQCRVTTEDPENKFTPELRQDPHLPLARAASASGSTAGMGDAGAVITPFYDSLLVKITAQRPDLRHGAATAWTARCASSAFAA